jgi:putative toxin-antitoxin system antitoxin component (TIGR02293 family)
MVDAVARPAATGSQPARIAALLGLEDAASMDDVALADKVAEGLGVHAATSLGSALGPMIEVVGGIIPEATFRRVRKGGKPLSREMSERLYEVGRVWEAARRSYGGDEDAAKAFLSRPHPLLDGRSPLELAQRSSAGADAVVNLMRRAEAGFAA